MTPDYEKIASETWPVLQAAARRRRAKRMCKFGTALVVPAALFAGFQLMNVSEKPEPSLVESSEPSVEPKAISDQELLEALAGQGPIIVRSSDGTKRLIRTRPADQSFSAIAVDF